MSRISDYWIAPYIKETVTLYDLSFDHPSLRREITIAIVSDLHAGLPFMPLSRIRRIVETTNALARDVTLFLGDLNAEANRFQRPLPLDDVTDVLGSLSAPLGVYGVLGNHDWWDDPATQNRTQELPSVADSLSAAGLQMLENEVIVLPEPCRGIVLAGLGDQEAYRGDSRQTHVGRDDLTKTLAQIPDGAFTILMAHEPDVFAKLPSRVQLTLSGHTHGGQVRLFGRTPVVPSDFGNRYVYGHVVEGNKHLIVSGGLGCSKAPLRFGVIPEIVHLTLTPTN
ncbi:metallophosphoesterase [Litoreibacter roseus]|uniref:Metallophosphoesterase n=1 Tax=Litoreibacter roseus TaxID=2601869 RepID=A0A6N6JCN4_9RHOB|nr:metallophosphoesterase [Litoreibacter roseus]GFE63915.1 metallophosphoesterase [Litoreibacter roseus]